MGKGRLYTKAQLIDQSAPCCVLALNMIKISSHFRLTTDSFRLFFLPDQKLPRNDNPQDLPSGAVHSMIRAMWRKPFKLEISTHWLDIWINM